MNPRLRLFEPGRIGKVSIKNRIVMAPMGIGVLAEPDGRLSQRAIDFYIARAKGGVGLIITGVTRVSLELEIAPHTPFAGSIMHLARFSELADALHDYGTKVFVQLTAGFGRVLPAAVVRRDGAVAPSVLPCFWDPSLLTRELKTEEIERLIQAFGFSAEILRNAGIDGIELHGHEGYLFDQFKTSLWNTRKDRYGGDLEGRLRFSLEVIKAIKTGGGLDFPIIYRFGLTHYLEGGREVEEGLEIARRLEATGVDCLHVDAGCYENTYWPHPSVYQPRGCMMEMAGMAKNVVNIPVIAVGKLGHFELAEKLLQEEKADFIAIGRGLLADPNWPNKVKAGMLGDIRPCIMDSEGCHARLRQQKYVSCTVNPATGMEREFVLSPAEKKKVVLVAGGGPAGMEAARVAALRGHEVVLFEKGDKLGGNLIPAAVPDFKRDYRDLISYLSTQMKKLGINIKLGQEATPELIQEMEPEVVFVATGSIPIFPDIIGVGKKKVVTAIDLLLGKKEAQESVVILGGGLVGCETGLYLAQKGKKITILEISDSVARDMFVVNRSHLLQLLMDANVEILTSAKVFEITDEGIIMTDKNGKTSTLDANTIVLAVGFKSYNKLSETLRDRVPEVYPIGDCVKPRRIINAIWEGFRTARLI